ASAAAILPSPPLRGRGLGVTPNPSPPKRGRGAFGSMEEPEPEAEDLLLVLRALDDREAEVEGDRHRAQHRHHEPHAGPGRYAVVLDLHPRLHRAAVHEGHQEDLVVGLHRHLVLEAVQEHEVAADLEAVDHRADAAELEAAHAAETTG